MRRPTGMTHFIVSAIAIFAAVLTACAAGAALPPSTPPTSAPPTSTPPADPGGIHPAVDPVLDAIRTGDRPGLRGLIRWRSVPCTAPAAGPSTGAGAEVRCDPGVPAGTMVRAIPLQACVPLFVRDVPGPTALDSAWDARSRVYAVARLAGEESTEPADNGRYAVILELAGDRTFMLILDQAGMVLRVDSGCAATPAGLLASLPVDLVLAGPIEDEPLDCDRTTPGTDGYPVHAERSSGDDAAGDPRLCLTWRYDGRPAGGFEVEFSEHRGDGTRREFLYTVGSAVRHLSPRSTDVPGTPTADCNGGIVRFRVYAVEEGGREPVGGIDFSGGCEERLITAGGCAGPVMGGKHGSVSVGPVPMGDSTTLCVTWIDRWSDEAGYRVELSYPVSGERFTFEVEGNRVDFLVPAAAGERPDIFGTGIGRKDYQVRVFVLLPGGEETVGGHAVTVG